MSTLGQVKTDTFTMKYLKFGTGEKTMVVLPGLSLFPICTEGAAVEGTFSSLLDDFTVYLFDPIENVPEGYEIVDIAEDSVKAFKELGLQDIYLFGASQGGMAAQVITVRYPELIKKLALGSTIARQNPVFHKALTCWSQLAAEGKMKDLAEILLDQLYCEETSNKIRDAFFHVFDSATEYNQKQFARLGTACTHFDAFDEISNIQCPTLVIGCLGDKTAYEMVWREIAETVQNGELFMYGPEYGHSVFDEAPDFYSRVKEFFLK